MREAARFIAGQSQPAPAGTLLRFLCAALGSHRRSAAYQESDGDMLWHVMSAASVNGCRHSEIATTIDAGPIADLVNAAYRGAGGGVGWTHEVGLLAGDRVSSRDVATMISEAGTTVLVKRGTRSHTLIGCVAVQMKDQDRCTLSMLAVAPRLQAAGLGHALLADAERSAGSNGARSASMTVLWQRTALIAWYERHGYRRTGTLAFPYGTGIVGTPLRDDLCFIVLEKSLKVMNGKVKR